MHEGDEEEEMCKGVRESNQKLRDGRSEGEECEDGFERSA